MAGSISTMYKSVTFRKERPIGAIRAVRASACPLGLIPHTGSHVGGTQWHALSAANVRNRCSSRVEGTHEHRVGHGMCSDSSSRPVEPDRMRCHATGSRSPASRDALPIIAMVVPKDAGSNLTASRLSSITTRLRRRRSRRLTWLCPPSTFIRPEGV